MPAVVDGTPWLPSSWRDLAAELTAEQMAALAKLGAGGAGGANPGMLLVEARRVAARNLDGWL